jgi:voltage-gated potassium channel Kch
MSEVVHYETAHLRPLGRAYLSRRYAILFYTLLLTLVAAPILTAFELTGALIELLLAASLVAAVMPVSAAISRRALLTLTGLLWVARFVFEWFDHPALSAIILGLWTVMGLVAAAYALRFSFHATEIDTEHLYAALSAYLLAGIFFGSFYWVLEQIGPGTFQTTGAFTRMSAIYFSFVTLATLGYGDIVPRTDIARGLAIVEGVGGQLFLAVLVARLVSLYGRSRTIES